MVTGMLETDELTATAEANVNVPVDDDYTGVEIQQKLRISRSTYNRLAKEGKLPPFYWAGSRRRFPRGEFVAWWLARTVNPVDAGHKQRRTSVTVANTQVVSTSADLVKPSYRWVDFD